MRKTWTHSSSVIFSDDGSQKHCDCTEWCLLKVYKYYIKVRTTDEMNNHHSCDHNMNQRSDEDEGGTGYSRLCVWHLIITAALLPIVTLLRWFYLLVFVFSSDDDDEDEDDGFSQQISFTHERSREAVSPGLRASISRWSLAFIALIAGGCDSPDHWSLLRWQTAAFWDIRATSRCVIGVRLESWRERACVSAPCRKRSGATSQTRTSCRTGRGYTCRSAHNLSQWASDDVNALSE